MLTDLGSKKVFVGFDANDERDGITEDGDGNLGIPTSLCILARLGESSVLRRAGVRYAWKHVLG